jgi:hypothetical protein
MHVKSEIYHTMSRQTISNEGEWPRKVALTSWRVVTVQVADSGEEKCNSCCNWSAATTSDDIILAHRPTAVLLGTFNDLLVSLRNGGLEDAE